MATEYEAAYHIEQARIRGGIPQTDSRFTDARMLALLTAEMQGAVAAMVHAAKSDHGVVPHKVTATANTQRYTLPPSAFANTLRDVYWLSQDGRAVPLHQISAADPRVYIYNEQTGTNPLFYVLQGSTLALYPTPSVAGTLAMPYYARPSTLVDRAAVATCDDVNRTGNDYTVIYNSDPPTGLDTDCTIDVVRASPGFESVATSVSATVQLDTPSAGFTTYTFTTEGTVSTGDYICVTGHSPVPQLPVELFPLLHARTAYVAVPSTGDSSQAANALAAQVEDLTRRAADFLRPRVESADPEIGRGMYSNPALRGLV